MIGTVLLVFLTITIVGAIPVWQHSRDWGFFPSGLGIVLLIVLILILTGRIRFACPMAALIERGLEWMKYSTGCGSRLPPASFACGSQVRWLSHYPEEHAVETANQPEFNTKINSWAEGTIESIDAEHGKFSIRGAKRPYASAYAQMTKEIIEKTKNLQGAERQAKEADVRNSWREKLAKAQRQPFERDSDFTFNLPKDINVVTSLDESRHYGQELQTLPAAPRGMEYISDREAASFITLKKLDIGEHVVVGYDGGIISNDVYAVLKANYSDLKGVTDGAASATDEKVVKADNTAVNKRDRDASEVTADQQKQNTPDIELTRTIRRAIVNDDSLSDPARSQRQDHHPERQRDAGKGPTKVNSNEEKANIEKKATDAAGQGHVTDQIDVLP